MANLSSGASAHATVDSVQRTHRDETLRGPSFATIASVGGENRPVALLLSILAEFHRQHLSYCYWRSTRRVSAALSGNSDLDLLIARDAQQRCQTILLSGGFKLFPDTANRLHPALCSYLGYDEPSGRIVHVHVHSHLAVGEALLKNYRLPWEAAILARAALHPTLPIKVLDPADEALLLVARGSLERRRTDPVALRHWTATSRKFELDRQQLRERLEPATLRNRAHAVFADDVADMVVDGIFYGLPLERQSRLQRRIRRELAAYRTFNAVEARARSWTRAVLWVAGGLNQNLLHAPRPWRRRVPGGGRVLAVIGVDGSGKTTVVGAIRKWLGAEVDVIPTYFGTGDGRPSLLLLPFKLMVPVIAPWFKARPKSIAQGKSSRHPSELLYSVLLMVWATVVAIEKRNKLLAAHRGARRGLIVVADRYPHSEELDFNDGPLFAQLRKVPLWLRRLEAGPYALARRLPPDLVIKLTVTPETAARREPDMDPAVALQRIDALQRLTFPGARVVSINADQPLAEVIRAIKREVWGLL